MSDSTPMAETTSTPSLRGTPDQFIVLCGQIVGNGTDGFQTVYGWDGVIHEERKAAIAAGWKERDSDDFNIGVIRDGRLASLDWMDESLGETAETLIGIEEQIDWRDPRDTFEVRQEADSLQQGGGESDFAWIARLRAHFIDPTALAEAVAAARAEGVREGLERAAGMEGRFWLELREPRCVPERKGPWPRSDIAKVLREFMAARPQAYITVVTVGPDGPHFDDGPQTLQMADHRSMSTGIRHIERVRAAHGFHEDLATLSPGGPHE